MKTFILPSRLKAMRSRLELTHTQLARKLDKLKCPVTTKTISNIEKHKGEKYSVRENTLKSLSRALGVQQGVLNGAMPLPDDQRSPSEPIPVLLDAQTRLNYDLLARLYGVSLEEVVKIAPLLFLKAAKESLARQKQVLEDQAMRAMRSLGEVAIQPRSLDLMSEELLEHLDDALEGGAFENCFFSARLEAIKQNDLFEETVPYYLFEHVPEMERPNPFADYLEDLCMFDLGSKTANIWRANYDHVPNCSICDDELEKITLGSYKALSALRTGAAVIKDIEERSWEPRNAGERVAFLEEKYALARQLAEQEDNRLDLDNSQDNAKG